MHPDDLSKSLPSSPGPGAGRLNGIIWAVILLWLLAIVTLGSPTGFLLALLLPWVPTLGAVLNLAFAMYFLATDRQQQAQPYFVGFVPLALLAWWLWNEFSHIGKFGSG